MNSDLITDKSITVMLVDDHPVVRDGYRRLLDSTADIHVVVEAEDGETAYALYKKHRPHVVILDLNMPGMGGLETLHRIRTNNPEACILVFSMHSNETLVRRALKSGASGYITKQCGANQMIQAIRQVKKGQKYIDPELAAEIVISELSNDACKNPLEILSSREFQIFKLIAEGNSCTQIAEALSISPKTVGVHQTNIMRKLKLQNIIQLALLAIDCNVIHMSPSHAQFH